MAWGIDQVDEIGSLLASEVLDVGLVVEGHSGGLDGDTTFLLIGTVDRA